jgi:pimeloyl-ACP methyl ester carboxylesterase
MGKLQEVVAVSALFLAGGAFAAAPLAERAAGIEYTFVERPANLQADFTAAGGASLRFLALRALDGNTVPAALIQPAKPAGDTTLVVSVHGSGGGFDTDPNGFLARLLAAKGFAVLGINTRQAGPKVNTDNFLEVRRDIEAGVYTARSLGYKRIVLHGHSLGNIQVQYYAANNWDQDIKAIVLTGMFANLPWKSRHLLVQNEQNWMQLHTEAWNSLREGLHPFELKSRMGWITGQQVSVTGQHFLTYRAEQSSVADGTYWIRRVPYPILMVRDAGDLIVQPFEPANLLSAATAPGSLPINIHYINLPNAKGPNPAAHGFTDNQQPLADAIADWLQKLKL